MPSIAILAVENCLLSGVVGPLEIFTIANSLALGSEGENAPVTPGFAPLEIVGLVPGEVATFTGTTLRVETPLASACPDILVIPPIFGDFDALLANAALTDRLRALHARGSIIASCCAGSFLLAQAGLLENKAATTHWQLAENFRKRYPGVDLRPDLMLIDGGHWVCAGGAMAWQDLALHLVARFMGHGAASRCAKILVMDGTRHAQTPYFFFDSRPGSDTGHSDAAIDAVLGWMRENYKLSFGLEELAEQARLGKRTFLRRFKRTTGRTPMEYLRQLRLEAARHLLEVSGKNIEEITALAGYEDSSSFRRLFKEKTGLTPKEYRSRFHRLVSL